MLALLKNEWAIRFVILLVGVGVGYKLHVKPEASVPVVAQEQECKAQIVRVTRPDGTKEERLEVRSGQTQKVVVAEKKKYLTGIKYEYDFKGQKQGYELTLGRKINDDLGVVFSYNSNHVAGVGFILQF